VDIERFKESPVGSLIPIVGTDGRTGDEYRHVAFVPDPLPETLTLSSQTWNTVSKANYALGKLRQGSSLIPNPALLRRPTLRREAQSTSALEGTFAPMEDVIAADVADGGPRSIAIREILNYVTAAELGFASVSEAPIITQLLCNLHALLVDGTEADGPQAGRIRDIPVAIGARGGSIFDARFVPMPPGLSLESGLRDLTSWVESTTPDKLDPVVTAAMAHYQFETLHPFNDGNGRIGRLLIVLQLIQNDMLDEPLLTVSPWFEGRRESYQEALANVSATGDWDAWVAFFARGIESSANDTAARLLRLLEVQGDSQQLLRDAGVRGVARDIVDLLIRDPFVTVPHVARETSMTYQAVSNAFAKLEGLGILEPLPGTTPRTYRAPAVLRATL
jgi:Fic family protein